LNDVKQATEARDAAQRLVDELREEETKLLSAIDTLADEARQGKAGSGRSLVELSGELGSIRGRLKTAEDELATAASEHERAVNTDLHQRFDALLAEANEQKKNTLLYQRRGCLALGLFCKALASATEVGNRLCVNLAEGLPVRNSLQAAALIDSNFANSISPDDPEPCIGWNGPGFDRRLTIYPIIPKNHGQEK
jgi:hypothetical protein